MLYQHQQNGNCTQTNEVEERKKKTNGNQYKAIQSVKYTNKQNKNDSLKSKYQYILKKPEKRKHWAKEEIIQKKKKRPKFFSTLLSGNGDIIFTYTRVDIGSIGLWESQKKKKKHESIECADRVTWTPC